MNERSGGRRQKGGKRMKRTDRRTCKLRHYRIAFAQHPVSLPSAGSAHESAPIDIRRVRQLFRQPARIAESDFLRREISGRMLERLTLIKTEPRQVLDAGCGEGADLAALQGQYTQAQIIGLDASVQMLASARGRQAEAQSSMHRLLAKFLPSRKGPSPATGRDLVCADFAQLPLAQNSVDLIWSNLALHWHPRPDRVFAEWRRVLRVDGLLMFSCFGPDTFKEMREAFALVDQAMHTLPFVDMHDFGDMLVNTGFSTPVMDMEKITVTYESPQKLLADVRAWGGNPLVTRRRGFVGRHDGFRILQALERNRGADGRMPLTFEIVYGHAFRPVPRTISSGEAIVRFAPRKK